MPVLSADSDEPALIIERAVSAPSDYEAENVHFAGINNTRGTNVHTLAILASADRSGKRAALVEPHLGAILETDSAAVRSTAAELTRALFPWCPEAAVAAFVELTETRDTQLFATSQFESLAAAVIVRNVELALPLIGWMVDHDDPAMREEGARLGTFAGTDGGQEELIADFVESPSVEIRRGAAGVLADRARWITGAVVHDNLARLFSDGEQSVREAAARVVAHLRGADLMLYRDLLDAFIASPALTSEIAQLAITLEQAPGEIIGLTREFAQRFLEIFDSKVGDIQTHAAADARQIGELVLRAYTQAGGAEERTAILDLVDRLLELNTYGFEEAVERVGRHG